MSQAKTLLLAACAVVTVVVAIQNTEAVDTRLLFVTVTLPRALLLVVTLLIGVVLGLVTGVRLSARKGAASG